VSETILSMGEPLDDLHWARMRRRDEKNFSNGIYVQNLVAFLGQTRLDGGPRESCAAAAAAVSAPKCYTKCVREAKVVWWGAYVEAALTGVAPATDDNLCDHLE
jgi:hypothetical protein